MYGYLNIGAVEEYRPCYDQSEDLFLGVCEDWPDERWIDAASPRWQRFVVDGLGRQYALMGLDGLSLDNADVYDCRPAEEVFRGLCAMLKGLTAPCHQRRRCLCNSLHGKRNRPVPV